MRIVWMNSFVDEAVEKFYTEFNECLYSDAPFIPVFINSDGGSVTVLQAIRDLIKASPKPVMTVAVGKAYSAGAFLLAAGSKGYRFVAPGADVMLHEMNYFSMGHLTLHGHKLKESQKLQEVILKQLAEDTGMSVAKIKQRFGENHDTDWYLTAQECVENGIADHAALPTIHVDNSHRYDIVIKGPPPKETKNERPKKSRRAVQKPKSSK